MSATKITPEQALATLVDPACAYLSNVTGQDLGSADAKALLLAICLQESNLEHRWQMGGGPARGLAQFEGRGAATEEVMTNAKTRAHAQAACAALGVPFEVEAVHEALANNDYLAIVFARLLLYSDPRPLPSHSKPSDGWDYYLRNWRPGKPRRTAWNKNLAAARRAVQGTEPGYVKPQPAEKPPMRVKTVPLPDPPPPSVSIPNVQASVRTGFVTSELLFSVMTVLEPMISTMIQGAPAFGPWGIIASSVFTIARTALKMQVLKSAADGVVLVPPKGRRADL